ncbi:homing endonuclease associated repeat-containing protein [Arthrobacter bambusae]|uniref:Uncharacterized protein n=1 Tax=Arthrobacter bambusae TaxID=1338426 RepID=A0AAW8D9P1_9MICC|nr:hypothetical protein [Arthrobacter bambusae]MDP9903193.1 hypothetical protein [Arthrobacter bambusae]MDQ0128813.1 hypothetical protein [Arthrobacter bambusae]MDQ0180154.1 hypothetical protein [Arthrobacter bambusae]
MLPLEYTPSPTRNGPVVYTDENMLSALRRLAEGEPTISRPIFNHRRSNTDACTALYEARFGSWNKALEMAGLETTMQPEQLQGVTTKWSQDQILQALTHCLAETGSTTLRRYEEWRKNQPDAATGLPSAASIRMRLGSWSHATFLACATWNPHHPFVERVIP